MTKRDRQKIAVLVPLVILLALSLGCAASGSQSRDPSTYSSEVYDASRASPATEQEVLDFLARDTTDSNVWIAGVYECGHFAADVWWNAYTEGLESCLVWVERWKWGQWSPHWLVKFHTGNEGRYSWLWIEPSTDSAVNATDYKVQDTFCGEAAFDICIEWWGESYNIKEGGVA
jgi:hypothetical protein